MQNLSFLWFLNVSTVRSECAKRFVTPENLWKIFEKNLRKHLCLLFNYTECEGRDTKPGGGRGKTLLCNDGSWERRPSLWGTRWGGHHPKALSAPVSAACTAGQQARWTKGENQAQRGDFAVTGVSSPGPPHLSQTRAGRGLRDRGATRHRRARRSARKRRRARPWRRSSATRGAPSRMTSTTAATWPRPACTSAWVRAAEERGTARPRLSPAGARREEPQAAVAGHRCRCDGSAGPELQRALRCALTRAEAGTAEPGRAWASLGIEGEAPRPEKGFVV